MAALEELGLLPFIRKRIEEGSTYKVLCNELRSMFPGVRGVSVRSIKRFCAVHGLRSTSRLSNRALDVLVAFGVGTVCQSVHGVVCVCVCGRGGGGGGGASQISV